MEKFDMQFMDRLPTVISCCFCCFLRAGSVLIAIVSFLTGLVLAPNVSYSQGSVSGFLVFKGSANNLLESIAQLTVGLAGVILCVISLLLLIGSLCNCPQLIEVYQWGAIGYCMTTVLVYLTLAVFCIFSNGECLVAGFTLLGLVAANILFTTYFIIVVNSLRMSMKYLNSKGIVEP